MKKLSLLLFCGLGMSSIHAMEQEEASWPTGNYKNQFEKDWECARSRGGKIGGGGCCCVATTASAIAVPLTGCSGIGIVGAAMVVVVGTGIGGMYGLDIGEVRYRNNHKAPNKQTLIGSFNNQYYRCRDHSNNVVDIADVVAYHRDNIIKNGSPGNLFLRNIQDFYTLYFYQAQDITSIKETGECPACHNRVQAEHVLSLCKPPEEDVQQSMPLVSCKALLQEVDKRYYQYRLHPNI